jgi:molybdopterin-guanine dinucleotide biosynthesis protein A
LRPAGVILAGGLASRMGGGDKTLLRLGGSTILERIIARLGASVSALAVNANDDPTRFGEFGLPVIADSVGGNPGPLAGILAGMDWAVEACPSCSDIVTAPGDAPFLPTDLVERLLAGRRAAGARVAIAASRGRRHPVAGLWPVDLAAALRRAVVDEGIRKVQTFVDRHQAAVIAFPSSPVDPFYNVNSADDLLDATRFAAAPGLPP